MWGWGNEYIVCGGGAMSTVCVGVGQGVQCVRGWGEEYIVCGVG